MLDDKECILVEWESKVCDYTIEDIDEKLLKEFIEKLMKSYII